MDYDKYSKMAWVTQERNISFFKLYYLLLLDSAEFCKSSVTFKFGQYQLRLNIVKNGAHYNNFHCITYTVYVYEQLLNQLSPNRR